MTLLKKLPFYGLAVIGGLLSGADIALSAGLLAQDAFLMIFFPKVYQEKSVVKLRDNKYCSYFNKNLTSIAIIPHILGWVFGFLTIGLESKFGPKAMLLVSSLVVVLGEALSLLIIDLGWFLTGKIISGIGMTSLRQVIPKYLGDASPRESRENLGVSYEMFHTLGIMLESILFSYDLGHSRLELWRNVCYPVLSLALTLFLCIFTIHESPKYLLFRNKRVRAIQNLESIQGPDEVQPELQSLEIEVLELRAVNPFKEFFRKSSLPHLCIHIPSFFFQSLMGSSTLLLFLPSFLVEANIENPSAYAYLFTCITSLLTTLISVVLIRHTSIRRRRLILSGCVIVISALILLGVVFIIYLKQGIDIDHLTKSIIIFMVCSFVMGSTFVANPMGWLVQSYPRTSRSVGSIFSRILNPTWEFLISMALLPLLCSIHGWTFILLGILSVLMPLFVYFLLPDDLRDVEMDAAWGGHRIWHRYVHD